MHICEPYLNPRFSPLDPGSTSSQIVGSSHGFKIWFAAWLPGTPPRRPPIGNPNAKSGIWHPGPPSCPATPPPAPVGEPVPPHPRAAGSQAPRAGLPPQEVGSGSLIPQRSRWVVGGRAAAARRHGRSQQPSRVRTLVVGSISTNLRATAAALPTHGPSRPAKQLIDLLPPNRRRGGAPAGMSEACSSDGAGPA